MTLTFLGTVLAIAVAHTLLGVDHTLPFVLVGRARRWSLSRLLSMTALGGLLHLASAALLGALGLLLGTAAARLSWVEAVRGELAAWGLVALGLTYASWAWWRGRRALARAELAADASVPAWPLLVLVAVGPCEPLLPLMLAPAAAGASVSIAAVLGVFAVGTLVTMLAVVAVAHWSTRGLRSARYGQVLTGVAMAATGLAVQALGL